VNITVEELKAQRHKAGVRGWQDDMRAAIKYAETLPHIEHVHVDLDMLEALGSRETNLENITGDGGHGRGFVQQDDRFQQDFLHSHKGCANGTNKPIYASALPKGRVPTIFAGSVQAIRIIEANIAYAKEIGVPNGKRMHFALAAYNAGLGGATRGWKEGDVDKYTAGGDYGIDVIQRRAALVRM
jgi:hypothetical protein